MNSDAGMDAGVLRVRFVAAWAVLLVAKIIVAATLSPFVDEAFYAWEGKHLAWAYSDLPGLTAWLIHLGQMVGGDSTLAMRAPFLLMGAIIPWQVVRLARRWFGVRAGWQAGLLVLLLPLNAVTGVLALPDVPLLLSALLCVEAIAALQKRVTTAAAFALALGLALGAFAHYRFAVVILAGAAGVLMSGPGRQLLREPKVWFAVLAGALAWLPLLYWNLQHAGAGLQFQLVERHPWQFHWEGAGWPLVQSLLLSPGLFLLLLAALALIFRRWREEPDGPWGLLLGAGGLASVGFFPMAFFVDTERLTLHWPHAGWVLLMVVAPLVWSDWRPWARRTTVVLALAVVSVMLGYLAVAAQPQWRERLADSAFYPSNFSGWREIADEVAGVLAEQPDTSVVVDNFKLAAQLVFALDLDNQRIAVLDHPLNAKHGRAMQLQLWGVARDTLPVESGKPVLLVVEDTARPLKERLAGYHDLCRRVGGLPQAELIPVDHGRKRFLLYRLGGKPAAGCVSPALAWIDSPVAGDEVGERFEVRGWAFKEGVGVAGVELTLNGKAVTSAHYGHAMPGVAGYWKISTDPQHPNVGFTAQLDLRDSPAGRYWLGLVLHGNDGSREVWAEQPIVLRR